MKKTVLILGSSEGIDYAEKMQNFLLRHFRNMNVNYDCVLWTDPMVWENGEVTLASLIHKAQHLKENDGFAVTLFTPDDVVQLRDKEQYCSRDNVWLEYGLFVGIMGISRVFAMVPTEPVEKDGEKKSWRKPSDFQQYKISYTYRSTAREATSSLDNCAVEVVERINHMFPPQYSAVERKVSAEPEFRRSY